MTTKMRVIGGVLVASLAVAFAALRAGDNGFSRDTLLSELSRIENDSRYASPFFDASTCLAKDYWAVEKCAATCFGGTSTRIKLDDDSSNGNWYAARLVEERNEIDVVSIPQSKFVWDFVDVSSGDNTCGRVKSIKVINTFGLPKLSTEFPDTFPSPRSYSFIEPILTE